MNAFYITTPIYYINARPHIGHAYTTVVADAIARARRLMGDDVFFLTGTDEHGQKVARAAQKAGVPPPAFADEISEAFRRMCGDLRITNDDFIRTTEPRHHRAAQAIWTRVRENGDIYKGDYQGWYCTVDEIFVPEAQLAGGRCPTCGGAVERLKEESYYFRLSKYQQPLLDWYRDHEEFLRPSFRLNEVRAFVESGLQDLSISRTSFTWGIPVPGDPAHVMYVWFDALTNYLTALGFGSDDPEAEARIARYWPNVTHLIGKEILRQHALYWPALLMSAGLLPPRRVIAHGFWLMGGAKMSKSIGNVARYEDYLDIFGLDALRYFMLREMPLGPDANFSDEAILARFNADLANDLGNVVSRTTTMIERYCDGVIPASSASAREALDVDLDAAIEAAIRATRRGIDAFEISLALQDIWELIGRVNKYIVRREPWALARTPAQRPLLETTLFHAADALRVIAALVEPVMPGASARIRQMLGVPDEPWTHLRAGTLAPGTRLGAVMPLFPRIDRTIEELREMTTGPESGAPPVTATPEQTVAAPVRAQEGAPPAGEGAVGPDLRIGIDDFSKVELRVARVLAADAVPKSKKLIKLSVDVGETVPRTVLAGIAEAYAPEQLVGRTIVIVANLKPAKLMGIESNGMVLAASAEGGSPSLLAADDALPPGSRIR